jgi:hypothetical protein
VRIWQKWLERRTRGKLLTWAGFRAFLDCHPLPLARIIHRYTNGTKLSREEPDAGILHVRHCEG